MAKEKKIDSGVQEFNMTPMIDVTFQLIIFFILAGQMASQDIKALIPPKPFHSEASEALQPEQRVIVNIVSKASDDANADDIDARDASIWYVGSANLPEPVEIAADPTNRQELFETLEAAYGAAPPDLQEEFTIEIRCDHRIQYRSVETVLMAAGEAGIPKMAITALVRKPGEE
jgi:biopolymer transport protein ExbD